MSILILGTLLLLAGVFGYLHSEQKQGAVEQAEDVLSGDGTNYNFNSISTAGIVAGIVLVVAGLMPEQWYGRDRT
ncbi:MAG: hypothetical protein ABEJ56_06675 [Candidatus Nanohaloarchaea archaeon]